MLNLNRAQVLGNLTRDIEMRYTPNGQAVANFTVATNRRWKNQDGSNGESTEYHDIVVWGKQAENVSQFLKKGQPVFVEGRLQTRNWEGQDGVKRYRTEIIADNVISLASRSGSYEDAGQYSQDENPVEKINKTGKKKAEDEAPSPAADNETEEIDIEEIPF